MKQNYATVTLCTGLATGLLLLFKRQEIIHMPKIKFFGF